MADLSQNLQLTGGPALRSDLTLEELQVPFSMAREATASQAWRTNPTPSVSRWWELHQAEYEAVGKKVGDLGFFSAEEARQKAKDRGLRLDIPDAGIDATVFNMLADRKEAEQYDQFVLQNYKGGLGARVALFGVGLGVSAVDPINLASAFVPVVGPARAAVFAGKYGATGGRLLTGAIEGGVGAALVEPLVYGAATAEQADYTMADSVTNLVGGVVLGGGLHAIGGKIKDAWSSVERPAFHPQEQETLHNLATMAAASGRKVDVTPVLDEWRASQPASLRENLLSTVSARPDTEQALADLVGARAVPILNIGGVVQAGRISRLAEIDAALAQLPAPGKAEQEALARIGAVEAQLKNEALDLAERKKLLRRRDELLTDTTPEALRKAADPAAGVRQALTIERTGLERQIAEAETASVEAALAPPAVPGMRAIPIRDPAGAALYQREFDALAAKYDLAPAREVSPEVQNRIMTQHMTDPKARDDYNGAALAQFDKEVERLVARGDDPLATVGDLQAETTAMDAAASPEAKAAAAAFDQHAADVVGKYEARAKLFENLSICGARP